MSMSNETIPDQAVQAWRARHEAFAEAMADTDVPSGHIAIDVNDLIGGKSQSLQPLPEDWPEDFSSDPSHPNYLSPNQNLTYNAREFPGWLEEADPDECLRCSERLLGRLARRKAAEAWEPLKHALDGLREPIHTVAINCLFLGVDTEKAARAFGTSVETIEFLTDIALDQLEVHVSVS